MPETLVALATNMSWFAIVLLFVGIGLVAVELFIPGIGVPGVVGAVCLVIGVILASGGDLLSALLLTVGILLILGLILLIAVHSAKKGRISRSPLVLRDATSKEQGYTSSKNLDKYLDQEGVTLTVLRPAGVALIGGERVDVVAEGTFLKKDERIRVMQVDGNRVVVTTLSPEETNTETV